MRVITEEFSESWKERQINVIQQTIGQLQHLDAAFGESYSILSELTYSAEGTFLISRILHSFTLR
jgi:hypothetical protein